MRKRILIVLIVLMFMTSSAFAAASFPNSKKTFSQVVNGVTKLVAALFNAPYDEIEAIETLLGAMGVSQSYSDSYKNLVKNYRRGMAIQYKDASSITVTAGEISLTDSSGNEKFLVNTSDTTVDWDDMDTGSEPASTTCYVYAVQDSSGTTSGFKISINATTPTGCTFYKLLGSFYNDSSSNIESSQIVNTMSPTVLSQMKKYDSGWFAVSTNTAYAKTHNLGTTKVLITILISDTSDGSGKIAVGNGENSNASGQMDFTGVRSLTTTTVTLRTGSNHILNTQDASGSGWVPTSGYARIIMLALE